MTTARSLLLNKHLDYSKDTFVQTTQEYKLPLLLIFLHIPLGVLLYQSSALALLYPIVIFFFGLYYAFRKHEKLEYVAGVVGYFIGVEVLWRMAQSSIFWEFGKYGAATIMIVALIQRGYWKIPTLPLFYLVFLIPACLLTVMSNSLYVARSQLSFNMSGPFLLFISCWFFSYLKVNSVQLKKLLLTLAIPLLSIAVTTLFYTVTTQDIEFTNESNFMTSGGFGPNQVSTMLGLGIFICLVCFLIFRNNLKVAIYLGVLSILFAVQSVMTFSRSGIYIALGASLVVIIFQMRNLSQNAKRVLPILGLSLIFLLWVFPYFNDFTGGKLQERFEDTETTNRAEIIEVDYQVFLENPILGVGVGEANFLRREILGFNAVSHTEFARLISEHGILGVFSMIALAIGVLHNFKRQNLSIGKAFVGGVIVWSTLYMLTSGMRLAIPAFIWGLSYMTIEVSYVRKNRLLKVIANKYLQENKKAVKSYL